MTDSSAGETLDGGYKLAVFGGPNVDVDEFSLSSDLASFATFSAWAFNSEFLADDSFFV